MFSLLILQTLRKTLNSSNLSHVQIVAADGGFESISKAILNDKELNASVSIVGYVYFVSVLSETLYLALATL